MTAADKTKGDAASVSRMRHVGILLFVGVLGCACAPARGETMSQAVESALKRFPDFRAAQANRRATVERVDQARAAYYPSADFTLGSGKENSDTPATRGPQGTGTDVTLNRREAELTVSQTIFDWGASWFDLRRSSERAGGATHQVANAAETVALRVGQAYLEVLRLRGQVTLAEENVAVHERTVQQVQTLVERGAGRRSDLQQAQGRLALAQSQLTQARGQLAQSEAGYRHLVGANPGDLRRPAPFAERLPDDIERVIKDTLAAHPAVLAAEREHNAAQ